MKLWGYSKIATAAFMVFRYKNRANENWCDVQNLCNFDACTVKINVGSTFQCYRTPPYNNYQLFSNKRSWYNDNVGEEEESTLKSLDHVCSYFYKEDWDAFWNKQSFAIAKFVVTHYLNNPDQRSFTDIQQDDDMLLIPLTDRTPHQSTESSRRIQCQTPNCDVIFHCFYRGVKGSSNKDHFSALPVSDKTLSRNKAQKLWCTRNLQRNMNARVSFRLELAYMGDSFCGWQRQTNNKKQLPSVQQVIEDALELYGYGKVNVRVSGRTDAGVHAVGQIARVRIPHNLLLHKNHNISSHTDCNSITIANRGIMNDVEIAHGDIFQLEEKLWRVMEQSAIATCYKWRCRSVAIQSNLFHPTFDTVERSYVYLIDASSLYNLIIVKSTTAPSNYSAHQEREFLHNYLPEMAGKLNRVLSRLEGTLLDYLSFSYGKITTQTTLCYLSNAKCRLLLYEPKKALVQVESKITYNSMLNQTVLAIELTGNRFLRRMVRILVSTALYHVVGPMFDNTTDYNNCTQAPNISAFDDNVLRNICKARDRRLVCKPAPPGGLIFVQATIKSEK